MQPAGGVDDHDLRAILLRLLDGLEGDGCRVLALALWAHDARTRAFGPRRELLDGRGAEGVGGTDDHAAVVCAQEPGELADGGRLADAVDAHDEHDGRALGELQRRVVLREPFLDGLPEHPLHVAGVGGLVAVDLRLDGVDDLFGEGGAEVGTDERGFEVVPRVLIDRLRPEDPAESRAERPGCAFCHASSLERRYTAGGTPCKGLPPRRGARDAREVGRNQHGDRRIPRLP
jgi:hypothetical protein